MPLEPLFGPFRSLVEKRFALALCDGGETVGQVVLQIEEEPRGSVPSSLQLTLSARFASHGTELPVSGHSAKGSPG